jgi:hypothetical protein
LAPRGEKVTTSLAASQLQSPMRDASSASWSRSAFSCNSVCARFTSVMSRLDPMKPRSLPPVSKRGMPLDRSQRYSPSARWKRPSARNGVPVRTDSA